MSDVLQHAASTQDITLSEAALRHVVAYLDKKETCQGLRLSLKKSGCSGLAYVVDYVYSSEKNDVILPLAKHYQLFVDKASYPHLKGMVVDYVREGLNYKFVFQNPNQTGQCGCGESFTVAAQG